MTSQDILRLLGLQQGNPTIEIPLHPPNIDIAPPKPAFGYLREALLHDQEEHVETWMTLVLRKRPRPSSWSLCIGTQHMWLVLH
jgi:hypothetical protein